MTFSPLLELLADIPDPRRAEGKLYKLPHVLLFSVFAIVCGSNSYRGVVTFIGLLRRTTETAFYVCNQPFAAERAATAIRAHWGIENTSHYARAVTLGEDRSRIRTKPGVFARLRSFAFNINKANRSGTMNQDRYRAALADIENPPQFRGVTQR